MAIYDRWWKDERADDGAGRLVRTGKSVRGKDYGCPKRWQVRWRDEQGRQRKQAFAKKTDAEKADTTIQAQALLAGISARPPGHGKASCSPSRWSTLDFPGKTLHVGVQVKFSRGHPHFAPVKNKKPRDIPVADRVVMIMAEHVRLHPPVPVTLPWHEPGNKKKHGKPVTLTLLFTRPESSPLRASNFNYYWRRAWKAAGVPDRGRKNGCHVLRHTAASAWLSAGLNPAKVAACLGDTAEVMLRTYAHFMPDDDGRARQAMNDFFNPTPRPSGSARFSARCRNRCGGRQAR